MAGANLPEDIGTQLADVERRLRALETAPRMTSTSQKGGTYRLISPNTALDMMRFGVFAAGGTPFYGIVLYDGSNDSMVMTRDDKPGLIKPDIPAPFHAPLAQAVTAAVLTNTYEWEPRHLYHDVLTVRCRVTTDGATTGEVRIRETVGGAVTDTLTIPINTDAFASFSWLHGVQPGDDPGAAASFRIETRRASGAGSFIILPPIRASMTSSVFGSSAANGAPAII